MKKNYIMFFDETDRKDLNIVGGKGANLGEMTKAGFPVPYGFCVTTESYRKFIEHNSLLGFITEALKDASLENINVVGERVREKIRESIIPEEVEKEILAAVNRAGEDNYYAVRSSATAEDLAFASFAGQQDTYLNIKGKDAVLSSVKDCWASLFTDRAILYRIQNSIVHEKVHMSVVVQRMVLPDVSGIMFTADPVSGHRGIISIDAGYGLGEALVSGLISPDIYKFKKSSLTIENKKIAEKKLAIMPVEGGGTKKTEIAGDKSKAQVVEDCDIKKLAELGMKIEAHYGCPQDIEWCIEDGKIYIVQSRAITSLFPMPYPAPKDDALHVYASFNHVQVMTDPISPLGIDMLRIIFGFDKGAESPEDYKILTSAAGRIYMDLSVLLQYKRVRDGLSVFIENADALMSKAMVELIERPDFEVRIKKDRDAGKSLRKYMVPVLINALKNAAYRKPEGTIDFINNYIKGRVSKAAEDVNSAKQGIEKLEAIYKAGSFLKDFPVLLPKLIPGMASFKILEGMEKKLSEGNKYVDRIVKGLEGNITTEMGLLVGDLADLVRKSPDLIREFENEDYRSLFNRINGLGGNDEFKNKLNSFMDKYDMRAAGEIDMAKDRWIENPEPLVKSIMAIVNTSREGAHRSEFKETKEGALRAAEEFLMKIEAKQGRLKAKEAKRLIRLLRNYLPAREHPKYLIMKLILIFKRALLEEAGILVKKGYLKDEKDIFYCGFWDIYRAIEKDESLIELVERRKEEYQHFKKLTPPRVLTSDGEEIKAGYKVGDLPDGALVGMPVSSGVIEGIARVITNPSNEALNKGEILVAPFTDPGWTPLFINASGLVMEVGGLLTHGTVVAREYGIPAVVGITDATKKIKTGQKIRVDGNAGFVMILEEQVVE